MDDQRLRVLFQQGVLDEQFTELLRLQDESSPNFISTVACMYFHDTEKVLRDLRELVVDREELDYEIIGFHVIKLMGSSAMFGAKRIRDECVTFRDICQQKGTQAGCLRSLENLKKEFSYLESKLSLVFQTEWLHFGPSANGDPMPQQQPPPPNNPSA